MPSDALAARCQALQEPVIGIIGSILQAGLDPSRQPEVLAHVQRAQAILAEGTDGITEQSYLDWHPTGVETFRTMADAIERGDMAPALVAMRDPETGLHLLGGACEGCQGW